MHEVVQQMGFKVGTYTRTYIHTRIQGGGGVWRALLASANDPDHFRFAAAIPICAAGVLREADAPALVDNCS